MSSKKKIIIIAVLIFLAGGFPLLQNIRWAATSGSAKLSWNANTEADLAGYKIYYGENKRTGDCPQGGYEKKIDAGKDNTYTINNLVPGKNYYFSVTSYNASGKESCFSEEMSKKISASKLGDFLKFFAGK
jgi:hypothetical protein